MDTMEFIRIMRPKDVQQLVQNWTEQYERKGTPREADYEPVVKLFLPWASATWLLTEMDEDGLAFGLCDLGHGTPELGYVSLDEVYALKGPAGLRVEQDIHFRPTMTLRQYADEAREAGRIKA